MVDGFTMTVRGGPELRRAFARLGIRVSGRTLELALVAGGLPIVNQAKRNAHFVTGTLRRSLHIGSHTAETPDFNPGGDDSQYGDVGGASSSRDEAEVFVGTDVPYGRREELGFIGSDSLGRRYNFSGHPYLRPAFDEKREEAVRETGEALKDLLRRATRG